MKNFLFISHDASRTGAPLVLLHFLKWLRKEHPSVTFDILLIRGGELTDSFRSLGDVFLRTARHGFNQKDRAVVKLRKALGAENKWHIPHRSLMSPKYEAVVANTVVSAKYLPFFHQKGIRTFCWLHELEYIIGDYYKPGELLALSSYIDGFIAHSNAGRKMLLKMGIEKPVDVVYEFSDVQVNALRNPTDVRKEWNIPSDAFVVGGCGTIEWRKGTDLFIQMADHLTKLYDKFYFVWVGAQLAENELDFRRIAHYLKHLAPDPQLIFTGKTNHPHDIFAAMDVFALTSREDPFPLVCMEAAALGKPIICFDGAGGMPEFVSDDAGCSVPYGDTAAFSAALVEFYSDRELIAQKGKCAYDKIHGPFAAAGLCRQLFDLISARS